MESHLLMSTQSNHDMPWTLDCQHGGDAGGVLRDLGAEMASEARRDGGNIRRHDARPPLLETARTARESCPRAYASLGFLGDCVPISDAAG